MPETPNHDYNVPSEGQEDWHVPLNENFEAFDTDIEIRDEFSNRGNYEPREGAKFFATDEGSISIGDGSSWNDVSTTGPAPRFRQAYIDSDIPLLVLRKDGDELVQLMTEKSGDAARMELSLFDAGGGRTPVITGNRQNHVGIGKYGGVPLDVNGQSNWNLDSNDGDVRIGDSDYRLTMGVALGGAGAGACNIRAKGGIERLNLGAGTDGHTVQIDPDAVSVNADLDVSGNKNFTQSVDTDDGEKEVVYTATEAGTPHTEASGFGELEDGRAEITLPEHFGWVTDEAEPLHVQTTPYSADSGGLAVVERSTDHLVVEDLDGEGDYEFSYTVKGTREGQADKEVVRESSAEADGSDAPAPADD